MTSRVSRKKHLSVIKCGLFRNKISLFCYPQKTKPMIALFQHENLHSLCLFLFILWVKQDCNGHSKQLKQPCTAGVWCDYSGAISLFIMKELDIWKSSSLTVNTLWLLSRLLFIRKEAAQQSVSERLLNATCHCSSSSFSARKPQYKRSANVNLKIYVFLSCDVKHKFSRLYG